MRVKRPSLNFGVKKLSGALLDTEKDAEEIARKAMQIAAEICVYTNSNFVVETLDAA